MQRNRSNRRRLALRTETVRTLTDGELGLAAGGGASLSGSVKCTYAETTFCTATAHCNND
jgi:hypothetical protein